MPYLERYTVLSTVEPLVVSPARACQMLSIGLTRCYELMNTKQLQSYKDGKSRKITVASIQAYITRQLDITDIM